MKTKLSINNIIYFILLIVLLLILVFLLTGHKFYYVRTSSMEPDIHQWSLICDKVYKDKNKFYDEVKIGSDITFKTKNGTIVTHRIISIDKQNDLITTQGIKGDATVDASISFNQVLGVVLFSIPLLGFVVMICQTWYFWVMLLCIIIAYFIIKELVKETNKNKK